MRCSRTNQANIIGEHFTMRYYNGVICIIFIWHMDLLFKTKETFGKFVYLDHWLLVEEFVQIIFSNSKAFTTCTRTSRVCYMPAIISCSMKWLILLWLLPRLSADNCSHAVSILYSTVMKLILCSHLDLIPNWDKQSLVLSSRSRKSKPCSSLSEI